MPGSVIDPLQPAAFEFLPRLGKRIVTAYRTVKRRRAMNHLDSCSKRSALVVPDVLGHNTRFTLALVPHLPN